VLILPFGAGLSTRGRGNTVSTYRAGTQQKMNMDNNAQLTQYAIANGLIDTL
jgi:DNA-binding CsgD family transcriptional regulator